MVSHPRVRIAFCVLLALFVLCIVMALSPANAEPQCAGYKELQSALKEKFHEQPSGVGLMGEKGEFAWSLFTSPKGESWTMVVIDATGKACVVGAGQNWVDLSPGKGEPT